MLTIIIPVYNEARTIKTVVSRVESVKLPANLDKEIIIVNDGSTDNTGNILNEYSGNPNIKIFHNPQNTGKASAVRLGIEKSIGDIILIQDADLEYNPEDYPGLIEPIIRRETSVVYGSRFKNNPAKMPLINRIANILSNATFNVLFRTKISDVHNGYKVFKKEIFKGIEINSKSFEFDVEITVKLVKSGYKIYEVPISYTARSRIEGKKISWWEAVKLYWAIIRYRLGDNNCIGTRANA